MKILNLHKTIAILAGVVLFTACAHEDQLTDSQLDYSIPLKTDLDKWIDNGF